MVIILCGRSTLLVRSVNIAKHFCCLFTYTSSLYLPPVILFSIQMLVVCFLLIFRGRMEFSDCTTCKLKKISLFLTVCKVPVFLPVKCDYTYFFAVAIHRALSSLHFLFSGIAYFLTLLMTTLYKEHTTWSPDFNSACD